mmetsp:Transcript_6263/g.10470  ORF Transcript_6263/g.10470 Transcript_6263/m.10470 type:complete len:102 (+) Transcript_6263:3-308(+)
MQDLSHPSLMDLVDVEHYHGNISVQPISVLELKQVANREIARKSTYVASMQRFQRRLRVSVALHRRYKQVVKALAVHGHLVDKRGADFLREILTGVSHCQD